MKTLTRKEVQVRQNGEWATAPVLISESSGGSGLPDVTAADNGKIPQVINGEWVMSLDTRDQLDQINVFLGSVESLTWAQRMEYVRSGKGRVMFPVGTQFNTAHGLLGNILWEVAAHDHFGNPAEPGGHTMTLISNYMYYDAHRCISRGIAIYSATEALPAGSYSYVIKRRTTTTKDNNMRIYFTLTGGIPAGGQIRPLNLKYNTSYDGATAGVYASATATTASETFTFTSTPITGAVDLGDAGTGDLNDSGCVDNGITDYDVSEMRQWLNSDADTGEWWTPQNKFSCIAYEGYATEPASTIKNWMNTEPGFLHDLDSTFLNYVCAVDYPCCSTTVFSVSRGLLEEYTVRDRFIIPTNVEVGTTASRDSLTVGRCLELFENVDNTKRIKYESLTASVGRTWYSRNPKTASGASNAMRAITKTGTVDGCSAAGAYGLVLMCTLA